MDARRRAAEDEATRLATLLDGGFVAPNEVEVKSAVSLADTALLLKTQANLLKSSLDVRDCVLRAPFDGEIGTRTFDPGAFVHPGDAIVSIVDRAAVRITVDASEKDFDSLEPSTPVRIDLLATGAHLVAPISRRSPRADPRTRTIHFEVDVARSETAIPNRDDGDRPSGHRRIFPGDRGSDLRGDAGSRQSEALRRRSRRAHGQDDPRARRDRRAPLLSAIVSPRRHARRDRRTRAARRRRTRADARRDRSAEVAGR